MLFYLITFHINFACFPARNVPPPPSNGQNPGVDVSGNNATHCLYQICGSCGEPSWLHNEGNVPKDDEETKPLMKAFEPLKVTTPPPSLIYSHTWLCFRKGRNSGGTHVSGCTVKYVVQSKVYRGREPALIKSSRPASICFHLCDLSPFI